tara:strand:+ start:2044 stop:2181 length:138 start_codon:yes stop_codon:yes gene_type:complete
MIKPNSHLHKMVKGIATKRKQKPEDCLSAILANEWQKEFGKSYLI